MHTGLHTGLRLLEAVMVYVGCQETLAVLPGLNLQLNACSINGYRIVTNVHISTTSKLPFDFHALNFVGLVSYLAI